MSTLLDDAKHILRFHFVAGPTPVCASCGETWPCPPVRLAQFVKRTVIALEGEHA